MPLHHRGFQKTFGVSAATVLAAAVSMFSQQALAHGYMDGERGALCVQGVNQNCSNVDPADTEHPGTFPQGGPPDGQIASATRPYTVLDEQSDSRWYKTGMSPGSNDFSWTIPAQHISDNFRYYITRPGWNPNVPLARSAFESTPFCEVPDEGLPGNPTHNCNVPERSGYHIILAVWQVAYTGAEFYSLLDVNMDGQAQDPTDPGDPTDPDPDPGTGSVINGGFETGDFSGWNVYGGNAGVDSYDTYEGQGKAYFWGGSSYEQSLDQTVTGLDDGTYTISAMVKQNTGQATISRLEVSGYGGDDIYANIPHGDSYVEVKATVDVVGGSVTVGFYQQAPGNTNLQIDNVQIVEGGDNGDDDVCIPHSH